MFPASNAAVVASRSGKRPPEARFCWYWACRPSSVMTRFGYVPHIGLVDPFAASRRATGGTKKIRTRQIVKAEKIRGQNFTANALLFQGETIGLGFKW